MPINYFEIEAIIDWYVNLGYTFSYEKQYFY